MPTDLEIANAATLEPIEAIAWKLGISSTEIMPMGRNVAKITWDALKSRMNKPQGSLVLVTSVNPTPFGEGKTVTTIGLTQALCRIGQSATCVIREPSMGPVFGIKGGAAGGGGRGPRGRASSAGWVSKAATSVTCASTWTGCAARPGSATRKSRGAGLRICHRRLCDLGCAWHR